MVQKFTPEDKLRIINSISLSKKTTRSMLKQIGINSSTYYKWYDRYRRFGFEGLVNIKKSPKHFWNSLSSEDRSLVIKLAIANPEKTPKDIVKQYMESSGSFISESSIYRILAGFDHFESQGIFIIKGHYQQRIRTTRINDIWRTDFILIKLIGWGYYYLLALIDDYAKYVVDWRLDTSMSENDPEELIREALQKYNLYSIRIKHQPRLITGNVSTSFIDQLKIFLSEYDLKNIRGNSSNTPYVRQFTGAIQPKKNIINLNNYYLPRELETQIGFLINYYNNECGLKSLNNLTPAGRYFGKDQALLKQRQIAKERTLSMRKRRNLGIIKEKDN